MRSFVACPELCQGVCEISGMLSYSMLPAIRGYGPEEAREHYGTCGSCGHGLVEVGPDGVDEARIRGYLHTDTEPCQCGKSSKACRDTDETLATGGSDE